MRRQSVIIRVAGLLAAGLLAACASTVNGSGAVGPGGTPSASTGSGFPSISPSLPPPSSPGAASSVGFPSGSSTPSIVAPTEMTGSASLGAPSTPTAGSDFACPGIVYPYAHLSFGCITSGMTAYTKDKIWPLIERKVVEPKVGWSVDMGAGHWGSQQSQTLAAIAREVRDDMVSHGSYGTSPTVTALKSVSGTVDGHTAHLIQTEFTINPAWAKKNGVKVKHEVSWIVAIKVGSDDVSLWYTSIPDLVSNLWAKVPAEIGTIRVI